jgi:hypothetical protein
MLRRTHLLLVLFVLIFGITILPANAGNDNGTAFALDCFGFTGSSGDVLLTRDNTGNDRESFIVSATDGIGNIIYEPVVDQFFVGGTVAWTGGEKFQWTASPQYNPLTLRVVSRAGNDLDEQLVTLATGACEGLPSFGATPEGVFTIDEINDLLLGIGGGSALPLGSTSPSLPLNAVPPRPQNPEEIVELLPGWLIVNIDNLSLRSGDGPEYTLIGIVDGGTELIPLGRNLDFSWWYVQAGDKVGWVKAEFLIARGDLTDVLVVPSLGEITPPKFFVFTDMVLSSSPSEGALELCTVPGNLDYLVVGRDAQINWYEIQATCDNAVIKGWVPAAQGAIRNPAGSFIQVTT